MRPGPLVRRPPTRGVHNVLVWSGSGTYGGHEVHGGDPDMDELLVTHDRAVSRRRGPEHRARGSGRDQVLRSGREPRRPDDRAGLTADASGDGRATKVRWGHPRDRQDRADPRAGAVRASQDGELVAVGSRDPDRAAALAAEFGAVRHATYDGVVERSDVDVVYVATHHPLHREWAVRAADAGKHVLCEKPLAVTSEDARTIVEAAGANGVFLLEAFAYRSPPADGTPRRAAPERGDRRGPADRRRLRLRRRAGADQLPARTTSWREAASSTSAVTRRRWRTSSPRRPSASPRSRPSTSPAPARSARPASTTRRRRSLVFEDRRPRAGGVLDRGEPPERSFGSTVRTAGSTSPSPWLPGRIGRGAEIVVERSGAEPETIDSSVDADIYTVEADAVNAAILKGERDPAVMPWEDSLANMRTLDRWRDAVGAA